MIEVLITRDHKTGHYPAVKTERQTFIPIYKCPYWFRFQNVKKIISICWIKPNRKVIIWIHTKNFFVMLIGSNSHCAVAHRLYRTAGEQPAHTRCSDSDEPCLYHPLIHPHMITFCPVRLSKLSWAFMNLHSVFCWLIQTHVGSHPGNDHGTSVFEQDTFFSPPRSKNGYQWGYSLFKLSHCSADFSSTELDIGCWPHDQGYNCINPPATTRVKISQNVDILPKVYLVHLKVKHCQTLHVVSTFTGKN